MSRTRPFVASADHRATEAGVATLRGGGNAVDAAIATNAVLAVTAPHLCGLGGDLLALVYADDAVDCLISAGRAGSRASAAELRADGHTTMPLFGFGILDAVLVSTYVESAGEAWEPEIIAAVAVWRALTILGPLLVGAVTVFLWRRRTGTDLNLWGGRHDKDAAVPAS